MIFKPVFKALDDDRTHPQMSNQLILELALSDRALFLYKVDFVHKFNMIYISSIFIISSSCCMQYG